MKLRSSPQSWKMLAQILAGVPEEEQAKIVGGNTARLYHMVGFLGAMQRRRFQYPSMITESNYVLIEAVTERL
jgi:hypothetical protein